MGWITCRCGERFNTSGSPNDGMHVVRDHDFGEYVFHIWETYQLCDIERQGRLPNRGTAASEEFHAGLNRSSDLEGELWECPSCSRLLWRRPGEGDCAAFGQNHSEPVSSMTTPR